MEAKSMRLQKREVRDAEALRSIVEACKVVRIGCMDEAGMFVVPMNFGYEWSVQPGAEPSLALWLHCAAEGRKAEAWAENPQVAIEMDCEDGLITGSFACAYSYAFRSIMGTGVMHAVTDPRQKREGLTHIMEHVAPGSPVSYSDQSIERVAIWRLEVTGFTGKQRV